MTGMMTEPDIQVLITVPFPEALIERLRSVSPRLKLTVAPTRSSAELPSDVLQEAEILYTGHALPDPDQAPELHWIQFHFAGIDHVVDHPLLRSDSVRVTTLSGAAVPQMAEFALMAILSLGRKLLTMVDDKRNKVWADNRFERFSPTELRDSTVGIVGYGSIGREVARLCRAFGAEVLAVKRDLMNLDLDHYSHEGTGDPEAELVQRIYPPEATASMAELCDFLVITVPLTPDTRGMIGAKIFKRMQPSSFLIDISRGGVVDHGALIEALNNENLAGAALDVYPVEPLPASSPLWSMPNVILSPHVAGASPRYYEKAAELFAANLRRYLSDQPLLNLFDPERGY
jgi:phosphoglycerate dehydrogenase-like enzyme